MAWFFLFIFVWSVASLFSMAVIEAVFVPFDQVDSIYGRLLHPLCWIAMSLGLTLPVFPDVRSCIRKRFFGSVATNRRAPAPEAIRVVVGLFVAWMGLGVNSVVIIALGRELSGVLSWGSNLLWTYLCYAWIFRGYRPAMAG